MIRANAALRKYLAATLRTSTTSHRVMPITFLAPPLHLLNPAPNFWSASRYRFGSVSDGNTYENIKKGDFAGPGFYVQQIMTSCLSIYSYYIESGDECFLIDPMN
jgi:hypothetical protein